MDTFRKWLKFVSKREWAAGGRETGLPVGRIPELWSKQFGESHGFPFKELGGTDVASIITSNCADIARVTADTTPLLVPPPSDGTAPPSRPPSFSCYIHMNLDKKRAPATGGSGNRGAKRDAAGQQEQGQLVSDQKASNPHPKPYTLHPTPYTLHPTPYTLHYTLYTLHPAPYTLHPAPSAQSLQADC